MKKERLLALEAVCFVAMYSAGGTKPRMKLCFAVLHFESLLTHDFLGKGFPMRPSGRPCLNFESPHTVNNSLSTF